MRGIISILVLALSTLSLLAQQNTSSIKGHVLDGKTDEHLPGVVIKIEGTSRAVASDETGHFVINNIKAGTYMISTQYLGYAVTKQEVKVGAGQTANISIYVQPASQELNEVAIVSTFRDLNRRISPMVVNQLTTKTFEATNSSTLATGLNYMPGLRVENNCQNCGTQEVRINGLKGEYSQILMDGQANFTSLSQIYGLEQLPTNMIEEVEVIRGGGSVLFGANVIGGILNIKTREPDQNSYEAKYSLSMIDGKSADNNLSINTSLVDRSKTTGISIFGNMRERNPWDANDDGFSEIGKNRSRSVGFRSFTKPGLKDKFTVEYHHISDYRRGGDNLNRPPHEAEIAESTDYRIHSGGAGYRHMSNDNKKILTVDAAIQSIRRDSYYGEGKDLDGYGNTSEIGGSATVRYEINMDQLLFMPAKVTFGFTQNYSNLEDDIQNRHLKQLTNVSALYAQNEWRNEDLTMTFGVRAEKHNRLGNVNVVPRASIRYKLNSIMNLRGAYSMGYRAPEVTASDLDVPIIGGHATITQLDEDLKREYSHSINGGVDFTLYNENIYSYFLVEGFYTKINRVFIEEEVGIDAHNNMIMMKKNGDGAYVYGVNVEGSVQPINWLDIQAGMTFQKSRYTKAISWSSENYIAPTKRMMKSPDTYGFMTATATPHKSYAVSLSGTYTGAMYVPHFAGGEGIDKDVTQKTKDFLDATVKFSYFFNLNPTNKVELNAGVQNIFDQRQKDYDKGAGRDSEYIYGPTLPRTYFIGVKLSSI